MKTRLPLLALVIALAWPAAAHSQQFISVPGGYKITDITPDGSLVVGNGSGGGFYWRWQSEPAPTFIGGLSAQAVSDDGSVITGNIVDPGSGDTVAGRWKQITGWVSLGYLPNAGSCPGRSSAYDISGDGSTVVGLSWDGCIGRGFRWTDATGMQELMVLGSGSNRATTISGDGSTIGGYGRGTITRTPAYWSADTSGFVVDPNIAGEVNGFTEDGGLSVGTMLFGGATWSTAFVRTAAGTITNLGGLDPANKASSAWDISEDGNTIVGCDTVGLASEGWMWTSSDGIVSLNDRLSALGVSGVPPIYSCSAASDDGTVVVGHHGGPGIISAAYIAQLADSPWLNIGGGSPGIHGAPILGGSGSLVGGTPAGLTLENARESTLSVAWVSFNPTPLAALGGTVHTLPYNNQFLFNTSPAGTISLNTTWPVGVPSGAQVWFQFLVADSTSIHGIVLSNGLKATTP